MCNRLHSALFNLFVLLHVGIYKKNKPGETFSKVWKKKYSNQVNFSTTAESISRRSLNYIQNGNHDSKRSTIRKFAKQMEMPAFVIHGFLDGEIEIDENNNWIIKKTGQIIEQYKP